MFLDNILDDPKKHYLYNKIATEPSKNIHSLFYGTAKFFTDPSSKNQTNFTKVLNPKQI